MTDIHKINQAKEVYVDVMGVDNVFYAKVSKASAKQLINDSNGELEVSMVGRDAYIGRINPTYPA